MNLPALSYECVHCGFGCQQFDVELTRAEFDRIEALEGKAAVEQRDERLWLHRECGSCTFLLPAGEIGRCGLHRSQGVEVKPRPCREFPFRTRSTPGGVFVGASFACTAILEGHGPPVDESMVVYPPEAAPLPPLAAGVELDWDHYVQIEEHTRRLLLEMGNVGLWQAPLALSTALLGPRKPGPGLEPALEKVFRGLMALAEGPLEPDPLLELLGALASGGSYHSNLLGRSVDAGAVMARWAEPWPLWDTVLPFFEHLLFRKYLLEGPDVHSRLCSLPVLAQLLQYLTLAHNPGPSTPADVRWAIRQLECKLTFHARGLDGYLSRCGAAFLDNLDPV